MQTKIFCSLWETNHVGLQEQVSHEEEEPFITRRSDKGFLKCLWVWREFLQKWPSAPPKCLKRKGETTVNLSASSEVRDYSCVHAGWATPPAALTVAQCNHHTDFGVSCRPAGLPSRDCLIISPEGVLFGNASSIQAQWKTNWQCTRRITTVICGSVLQQTNWQTLFLITSLSNVTG